MLGLLFVNLIGCTECFVCARFAIACSVYIAVGPYLANVHKEFCTCAQLVGTIFGISSTVEEGDMLL